MPTTTPAGIQLSAATSVAGKGNIDRSSGVVAAARNADSTADTWTAMPALPVATIEVACSYVVPFGLSLKYPFFCSSRYLFIASTQPESANDAWPAAILSSKSGVLE